MGCSESTPKGGKKGTAPVRRQQKEQSPKNSAQDVQEKVTEPAATATAPPSPPPPNNATPDNQKIPPADKIPPSVRSNDDELFDRSIKSLARSRGGSRTRSPKDGHLDIRSMSSEDTSQFALNASTGGLVRCATLNMSFSHGSPQGGSKPQVPPSVQAVKQIVGDKAMIDSLEETARLQRDPMPPAMLGEGLNGAASPISEKSTHSITVSIPRLPPQASSCGGSGLIDVQQILSGSESDDIIATESGSESNEIHRDKSISKSEGGGRSNLLSPEPSGNLYLASSKSLLRLRSLRQTSHAMSFTTDFLAKSHNGGQYMLKITACDAEPTKRKEIDTLQGNWEDLQRNYWTVKERKALVNMRDTNEKVEYLLEDSKDYNSLGKVTLIGEKVVRHEWSQIVWSDGDEWQQVWDNDVEVDVYYGEEEGWFAGRIKSRGEEGLYVVLFEDGETATDVEGAHMRDRETSPLQGIYLMPPENPY